MNKVVDPNPKSKKTKYIKVHLPPSLYAVLKDYSKTKGISMSDIVKISLYEYFEKRSNFETKRFDEYFEEV